MKLVTLATPELDTTIAILDKEDNKVRKNLLALERQQFADPVVKRHLAKRHIDVKRLINVPWSVETGRKAHYDKLAEKLRELRKHTWQLRDERAAIKGHDLLQQIEQLRLSGVEVVTLTSEQLGWLHGAKVVTRVYESTFGQTLVGQHSSMRVRLNDHGYRVPDEFEISTSKPSDITWLTIYPLASASALAAALAEPPHVTMDQDNLAYQRELLRG